MQKNLEEKTEKSEKPQKTKEDFDKSEPKDPVQHPPGTVLVDLEPEADDVHSGTEEVPSAGRRRQRAKRQRNHGNRHGRRPE